MGDIPLKHTVMISDEVYESLERAAKDRGRTIDQAADDILAERLAQLGRLGPRPSTLNYEEMAALVQQDFEKTGMTDEEHTEFIDDFVHRVVRGGERQPDGTVKYKNEG